MYRSIDIASRSSASGRHTTLRWQKQVFAHTHTAVARLPGVSKAFLYSISARIMCRFKRKLQRKYPRNGLFWHIKN